MKKTLSLVLAAIMCLTLMAGCGQDTPSSTPAGSKGSESVTTTAEKPAEVLKLKLDSGFTAGTVLADIPQEIIKRVSEASKGTIVIEDFPQDALGTSPERAPMLIAGELDISVHALSVFDQYNPKQTIMNAFFMFESWDHYRACQDTDVYRTIVSDLEKAIHATLVSDVYLGRRNMLSKKPIQSLADLKGVKFRVPNEPMPIAAIKALGAAATPVVGPEVYTALQNGTAEATESPAAEIVNRAFYEVINNLTFTAHQYQTYCFFISDPAKARMTEEQYNLITSVIKEVCDEYTVKQQASEAEAEKFLREKCNCYDIDLTEMRNAVQSIYDDYDDVWGDGAWETFKALAK
ncbi:MAG: TRAP transporter substrate-binding protein [Lachnospiraceae bacterium]|nr:TRAP transporter substrate-binding protein [Lachnospiraceae bacterium]